MKAQTTKDPIHQFFGLSYASYLVCPRALLQSCSQETQQKLCDALEAVRKEEEDNMNGKHWPYGANIHIQLKEGGKFAKDPLANYERGRRRMW